MGIFKKAPHFYKCPLPSKKICLLAINDETQVSSKQ